MHHFVTECARMGTFLSQNGALWDMGLVHCEICATGFVAWLSLWQWSSPEGNAGINEASDSPSASEATLKNTDNKLHYNMVGVAVAMVISTMHEKSCIDSHNARKFEKSSKIQSFTHLAITMMKLRKYHRHYFFTIS